MEPPHQAAGAPAEGEGKILVENPASGKILATVDELGDQDVAAMAARGRAAQPGWEAQGFDGRGRVLRAAQRWLIDNAERVIATIVSETGKSYEDALFAEVAYVANAFGFWARRAPDYLKDERVRSSQLLVKGRRLLLRHRPLGLIGVIGPWNYPLTNSFGDCIPALAAGNSVLLKPSEITPLTSLLMADALRECGLPEHVLQVATGGPRTGTALVQEVDMVMFTGSTRAGRAVAEQAARRLIPCSLELGGKDPMIVLSDANLERAATLAVYYAMQNAGQTCISIERVYVEAPVHDEFVALVGERARKLRVGPPAGPGTIDVGAITRAEQLERIEDHVRDALGRGARAVTGGKALQIGGGHFFAPTVLVDVDHTMKVMKEETFGPVLPIMRVRDAEEAVRLANDSQYGLGAAVFAGEAARGELIARRLEVGAANVNDALINYAVLELPMGGVKASGLGSRHGAGGIRKYCSQQAILIAPRLVPGREIHMYPYSARKSRIVMGLLRLLYGRGPR